MSPQSIALLTGKVRCIDTGGPGPAVLLTHGIGESLEFWHPQIEALGKTVRLVAWDMPGHGESDIPAAVMDLQAVAHSAWLLLDHLGIESAHLVGNSLGAAVSLRMLGQKPARTRSLLLANSATLGPDVFGAFKAMTLPLLGELMNKPSAKGVEMQIKAIVHRTEAITPSVRAAIERNIHRPGGAAYFLATLRMMTSLRGQSAVVWQESHQLLRQVKVPTLVLHGQQDVVLPVKHSEQAHALVPGSELLILDGCGHTPQLEQPFVFNARLAELVRRAEN
ncbi:MAG: alpha/beta fold hydrolase [Hydrogenophaga sp.]|uniref:alpha/beta fold hydrolase n=1 Tax=Hydrogenophaga sp. TaxID=1904254 RepID=UPI002755ABE4|nr:alpha/beta fold hydrolase [Hydrogenophaga sp.]MDP2419535.1 alpha/beta fold hydrolase [Hydrogenophaga sp.]MDZ4187702.1 alpha/beta fold hydrolase [Hydrogenophaga sp.]